MSSQRFSAKSTSRTELSSEFRPYLSEASYGEDGVELLLPAQLQRQLMDERRQKAIEREQARSERSAAAMAVVSRPAAAAGAPQSTPQGTSQGTLESESAFTQAFERGVARRDRRRHHPVLAAREVLRVAARVGTMREKDYAKRDLELIEKIKARGALRAVVNPAFSPKSWAQALARLSSMHPHFQVVTDLVAAAVARSVHSKAPLSVPPLHLWGEPGVGKTQYANDLAAALGTPVRRHSMENAQTTALLLGTERHWSTASPGLVFDQLVFGDAANPVVLIDELDKAPRGAQYDPFAPLHSLLEPATATRVRDASLDIEFDASLVIYIATSNNPGHVPAPLRSRFREFEILPPRGEQALQVARAVVAATVLRQAVPGFALPPAGLAHQLAHLTPREIGQAVQDAVGHALEASRFQLSLADFPADLLGVETARSVLH